MKLTQFVALMSDYLGHESKTIKVVVRNLREAGLFTTGARGVNAPDITTLDAARVAIAVVASSSPGRAVKDVLFFGAMKPDAEGDSTDFTKQLGLDPNKKLEETLVDCLENRTGDRSFVWHSLRLAETGEAQVIAGQVKQSYIQPDRLSYYGEAYLNEPTPENLEEAYSEFESCETFQRSIHVGVHRSAELSFELLYGIGSKLIGTDDC
jgi:hypothetical protein